MLSSRSLCLNSEGFYFSYTGGYLFSLHIDGNITFAPQIRHDLALQTANTQFIRLDVFP